MRNKNSERTLVAVDGEAASGKSTTSKLAAKALGYRHLDTGAMYRAAALAVMRSGAAVEDAAAVADVIDGLDIRVEFGDEDVRILLGGEDVTEEIRGREVSKITSRVSVLPVVRRKLVKLQRELAAGGKIVVEGRDIGTVVFPDANFKFFITASVEERARRRYAEHGEEAGGATLEEIVEDILSRDERDRTREISPLRRAEDAVVIDTTELSIEEQVAEIINRVTEGLANEQPKEKAVDVH